METIHELASFWNCLYKEVMEPLIDREQSIHHIPISSNLYTYKYARTLWLGEAYRSPTLSGYSIYVYSYIESLAQLPANLGLSQ